MYVRRAAEDERSEALATVRRYTAVIEKLGAAEGVEKAFIESMRAEFREQGAGAMKYLSSLDEKYEQALSQYVADEAARMGGMWRGSLKWSLAVAVALAAPAYFAGSPLMLGISAAPVGIAGVLGRMRKKESERGIEAFKEKVARERDEVRDALSAAERALEGDS